MVSMKVIIMAKIIAYLMSFTLYIGYL